MAKNIKDQEPMLEENSSEPMLEENSSEMMLEETSPDMLLEESSGSSVMLEENASDDNRTAAGARQSVNAARKARAEKAREEAERKEREEMERKYREKAERKARLEAERKAKKEAARKARQEAESKAKEEAARKEREEAQRKAREEAERKAKAEAERKAREEAERKAREEAQRKAREEAERKAKAEAERKAREEAQRKAREEAERKAKAEAERKAREEAERREEAVRKAKEEAIERKANVVMTIIVSAVGVALSFFPLLIAGLHNLYENGTFWDQSSFFAAAVVGSMIWFGIWHAIKKEKYDNDDWDDKGWPTMFFSAGLNSIVIMGLLMWQCHSGIIEERENELKAKYDSVYTIGNDGLRVVSLGGKKGLVDERGKEVIEVKYDEIRDPQKVEELFKNEEKSRTTINRIVESDGKKGLIMTGFSHLPGSDDIDQTAQTVFDAKYDSIYFDTESKCWTSWTAQ